MAAGSTGLPAGKTYADLTTLTTAGSAFYQNTTAGFMQAMVDAGSHTVRPTERIAGVQIMVADDGKFKKEKDNLESKKTKSFKMDTSFLKND